MKIATISNHKQAPTTQRWKILLTIQGSALPLHTKIEFSRRHFGGDVKFEAINPQLLKQYSLSPIMVNHYSLQSMYEQKILALALRTETQSRDIFDLYLLINSGEQFNSLGKETLQHIETAKANATGIHFSDFKGQVIAYLSEDDKQEYDDKAIWKVIVKKVIQALDGHQYETD